MHVQPNDFDQVGFLGDEIDSIMKPVLEKGSGWYRKMDEMNRSAMRIKEKIIVKPGDLKGILAAALFIKVTNCFQAIVLLSRKGLGIECAILTRALLEVTFPLKATAVSVGFAEDFILTEKFKQLKLMNIILNDKKIFTPIQSRITPKHKNLLAEEIKTKGLRYMTTEEIAKRAEMEIFYQFAYRHLSEDVHTTVRSLEAYVVADGHGDIAMFESGPQIFDAENFKTAAACLLIAMDSMNVLFDLKMDSELQRYEKDVRSS